VFNAALAEVPGKTGAHLYEKKALQFGKSGDSEKAIENLKPRFSFPKVPSGVERVGRKGICRRPGRASCRALEIASKN